MNLSPEQRRRLRGMILELVLEGHAAQRARLDVLTLTAGLMRLGWSDIGRNDVTTALQDLHDRTYLRFHEQRNVWTGRVEISKIEITAQGRDIVEKTETDPAVELR